MVFNCIYFGGQLAFRQFFFSLLKTLVFKIKRYSILFFCSSNCLLSLLLSTHFFYSVHTISHVWKKLRIPAPYILDQFYYYRSNLPTLLSTFSKISQNFRHYPVFYMHTITCSFQAEGQWKRLFFFLHFSLVWTEGRQYAERLQTFFGIFSRRFLLRIFFIEKGGFSIYKYLRNQGRKRCKTNVNFQFIVTFLYCFVQNGTIHEKKAQSFFAAAQYCGRKIGHGLSLGWATTLTFFSFLHFYFFLAELFCSVFVCFVFLSRL